MKSIYIKSLLVITLLILVGCSDEITELQKSSFIRFYGSYQADVGKDIANLASGGYAITGTMVPDTIPQMFLIRTDEAGNQVDGSPSFYGGSYQTAGNSLLVLHDGYLIGGTISDTAADGEIQTDMFLVRTDAAGEEIWSKRFGNQENDAILDLCRRNNGDGFVLAGKRTLNEDEDVWILMVDDKGVILHDFIGQDSDDDDEANFVMPVPGGYLCASTYDGGAMEGTDIYVVSLDEACGLIDSKSFGTADDDLAGTIIKYNEGFLVGGYTENTATGLNEIAIYSFTLENNVIKKPSAFGKIIDPQADLSLAKFVLTREGTLAIIGTREISENRDIYLAFIGSDGKLVRDPLLFGELGNQSAESIVVAADGGLVFTGTHSLEGNSLVTLIKTKANGEM